MLPFWGAESKCFSLPYNWVVQTDLRVLADLLFLEIGMTGEIA